MEGMRKISFIIYVDDEDKIFKAINSIVSDQENFQLHGEIIVVGFTDDEKIKSYYSNEAFLSFYETPVSCEADAYITGLQSAKGEYVCFMRSSSFFDENIWLNINKIFKSKDSEMSQIINIASSYINPKGETILYGDYNFIPQNGMVDLEKNPEAIHLCLGSYFIKKSAISKDFFSYRLTDESIIWGLIELLEKKKKFYFCRSSHLYFCQALETDSYNYRAQFTKNWYMKTIDEEWIPRLKKYKGSGFIEHAIFYLLKVRYSCNWNDRNKSVIEGEEVDRFFEKTKQVLQYIDNKVITDYRERDKVLLPKFANYFFLKMKYGMEKSIEQISFNATFFCCMIQNQLVDTFSTVKASVWAINYMQNKLCIDGRITNVYYFPKKELNVYIQTENYQYCAKKNNVYALNKFFNVSVVRDLTFTCEIPENEWKSGSRIWIMLKYRDFYYKLPIQFSKIQSRITNRFTASYWLFDKYMLSYDKWHKCMIVKKAGFKQKLIQELHLYFQFMKAALSDTRARKVLLLRAGYWITRPFYCRKNIWMTFDQLFKGGDNGEYFFRYVSECKDKGNIRMYYVLNKTAPEYKTLHRKYGNKVLIFNSIRHKLISLHTDMIFATRVDVKLYCGFAQQLEPYFRGLFNGEIFCLQHGLTIQRIAQYQHRLFDNTRLYFCVSPYEKKNLLHSVYDYKDNVLLMTGAPRYDGLVSKDKKQILITPTWRRSVTAGTNSKGSMNEYSVNFKHTEYFKLYNTLINDEQLITCAKKTGYKLIYLIHPILSPQIQDYDTNDFVQIIPGSKVNYEKILSESSLMVTDYSGVQFDFAYMRKPLIYYHPDTLPPQYEAGGLEYETMGFGPVCKNHEKIVEELCFYMEKNCQMTDLYKKRVDDFFAYNDRENCKRVYEATIKYMKQSNT